MSHLDDLATYLAAVTPTLGPIYTTEMPENPDACLMLQSYGGQPSETGFGVDGLLYESPGLQVTARGVADDEDGPQSTLYRAYKELAKIQARTLSGTLYLMVTAQQTPFKLKVDAAGRLYYVVNFICKKKVS